MIKNFIIIGLLALSVPCIAESQFVKFDLETSKTKKFSKKFYKSIIKNWPKQQKLISKNSNLRPHYIIGQQLKINSNENYLQWNIYGEFGVGKSNASGTRVAIIDTGITNHINLQGSLVSGIDMVENHISANDGDGRDLNPEDPGDYLPEGSQCDDGSWGSPWSSWHGTHVAGIIAMNGKNNSFVGVNSQVEIVPIRALGSCGGTLKDVLDSILWASGEKVDNLPNISKSVNIINLSLGGSGKCPASFQQVLNKAFEKNILVVVSAGNSALDLNKYEAFPANCDGVINVSASGPNGELTYYSNFGGKNNVIAPGGVDGQGIISTLNNGINNPEDDIFGEMIGSSMSAPHVTGVLAGLINEFPEYDSIQIKNFFLFIFQFNQTVVSLQKTRDLIYLNDGHIPEVSEEENESGQQNIYAGHSDSGLGGGNSMPIGCGSISSTGQNTTNLFFSFCLKFCLYFILKRMAELQALA